MRRHPFLFLSLGILFFVCIFTPFKLMAQASPEEVISSVLKKPEESKSGLLVLQFGSTGLTETAAKAFSNMIAQNLHNTHRFEVIGPEEAEKIVQKEDPSLLPCFDIGCGIQMGNILGSERVLTGHLSLTPSGSFSLSIKLVHIFDNSLQYEDTIRFSDKNMDRRFYQLAARIAENTPLIGTILDANNKIAVISLGERNGISVGDKLVIYRNKSLERDSDMLAEKGIRRKNIGVLKITKVGDKSSEGVYFQSVETPEPRQFVMTYLDRRKQIQLIEDIRKELDTHERTVYEIKKVIKISPVRLEDIEKKKWIRKIRILEEGRDLWQNVLIGTGVASAYFLTQYKEGDDFKLMISFAALGYSTFEFFNIKNRIKELVDEGKFKGYLDVKVRPESEEAGMEYRLLF